MRHSGRLLEARLKAQGDHGCKTTLDLVLFAVYIPFHEGAKWPLWPLLTERASLAPRRAKVVLGIDANGTVGCPSDAGGADHYVDNQNAAGSALVRLCKVSHLRLASTLHAMTHPATTLNHAGLPARRIDFVAASHSVDVISACTRPDIPIGPGFDHVPLILQLDLLTVYTPVHRDLHRIRWDRDAMRTSKSRQAAFSQALDTILDSLPLSADPARRWRDLQRAVLDAARGIFYDVERVTKQPWVSQNTLLLIESKARAYTDLLSALRDFNRIGGAPALAHVAEMSPEAAHELLTLSDAADHARDSFRSLRTAVRDALRTDTTSHLEQRTAGAERVENFGIRTQLLYALVKEVTGQQPTSIGGVRAFRRLPETSSESVQYLFSQEEIEAEYAREACRLLNGRTTTPSARQRAYQLRRHPPGSPNDRGQLLADALTGSALKESFAGSHGGRATKNRFDPPIELIRAGGPRLIGEVIHVLRSSARQLAIPPSLQDPRLSFLHKPGKPRDVIRKSVRPVGVTSHAGNAYGGVLQTWIDRDVTAAGGFSDSLFGYRMDAPAAIWAALEIVARALACGKLVAELLVDIQNFFCSVKYEVLANDLSNAGASPELHALVDLIHQDLTYELQGHPQPGSRCHRRTYITIDEGFVQGHRGAPSCSLVVMDQRVKKIIADRARLRPDRVITVTYTDPFTGEQVTIPANEVVYADDLDTIVVFDADCPDVSAGVRDEAQALRAEFTRAQLALDLGDQGKSGFLFFAPRNAKARHAQRLGEGVLLDETSLPRLRVVRHLGFIKSSDRRLGHCDMTDSRIIVARKKFYPRVNAVWRNRAMYWSSKRTFLYEVLQALAWGLECCALSETNLAVLESEERHFMYLICKWCNYAPHKESLDPQTLTRRIVSYRRYLVFWNFSPLHKRLQISRLRFARRLLFGPARLGRALLLGVLSFEGATRTTTAWDCLLDADLQLLNAHYGTTRSRE